MSRPLSTIINRTSPGIIIESMFLPLVERVDHGRPDVDDGRAAVAVLLQPHARHAVVRVRHRSSSFPDAAHHAPLAPGPAAVAAAVADAGHRAGPHHGVAGHAAAVVRRADAAHGDARQPRAPHEVGLVPRHGDGVWDPAAAGRTTGCLLSRRCFLMMSMCRVHIYGAKCS